MKLSAKRKRLWAIFLLLFLAAFMFKNVSPLLSASPAGNDRRPAAGEAPLSLSQTTASAGDLEIHFLDVGQGLAVFARSGDQTLLYDGGDRDYSRFVAAYLQEQGVETLDYVIASHYDADHLNGLVGALNLFPANTIIGPDYLADSKVYTAFIRKVKELGQEIEHPDQGTQYKFGGSTITVLSPQTTSAEPNDHSLAVKLDNGRHSLILTGDGGHEQEAAILSSATDLAGINLSCTVLVAGHHGSANSTSWDFLQKTVPEYAVISCAAGNSYGHPHADTMEKLAAMEIDVFRTDIQGTVILHSDGSTLSWNQEPSNDYSSGDQLAAGAARNTNETPAETATETAVISQGRYVLNKNTKKAHLPDCRSVPQIKAENYAVSNQSLAEILDGGYVRCKNCLFSLDHH